MKKLFLILLILSSPFFAQVSGTTTTGKIIFGKKTQGRLSDKTPPLLEIISHPIKAMDTIAFNKDDIVLRIKATDSSGIKSLNINSIPAVQESKSIFVKRITSAELKRGSNSFNITAVDNNDNISQLNFSVSYTPDLSGPGIKIIEPVLPLSNEITIHENTLAVQVQIIDDGAIKEVYLNNIKADELGTGEYFANIPVAEGKTMVHIKASDINNNISEKRFMVNRIGDITGPIVKILEPYATRGINIIHKNEVITIKGIALDESGVKEITINNRIADLVPSGEFNLDVYLVAGDNNLIVRAIDNKFNITLDTFIVTRKIEEIIAQGKYYALIVGINNYSGFWPPLMNAVNDAKAFEDAIRSGYKFDAIFTLYDDQATRRNIIQQLEYFESNIKPDDNLLIFYSGHGDFRDNQNRGYWVPYDATTNSTVDMISNPDIQTHLRGIRSRHTLLVADACFMGDIFRGRTEMMPFENSEKYFREVYRLPSRKALTSGGVEPVTDGGRDGHSVFTYYMLRSLNDNKDKYYTAGQLFENIRIPIVNNSEQRPVYQAIRNTDDEGGEFVFIKK